MTKTFRIEKDVKKEVKRLLDQHDWFWWMPPANGFGKTGIADFNAVRQGVFMAVETKFGNNTVTAMQRGFLNSVASEESFAFVVNERNIEWFAEFLKAFDEMVAKGTIKQLADADTGGAYFNAVRELTSGWM